MWMVIAFLAIAASLYVFKSLRDVPGDAVDKATYVITNVSRALIDVAAAFNQGTITTSFISYATSVNSSQFLQFATLRQSEIFTQTDQAKTAFGYLPLPDIIVEARAPVEYTYYLDLNAKWEVTVKDNTVYVIAPRIQFNKPAVDASEITYDVRKGSVFRDKSQALENLKKAITFLAQQRARENIAIVRETGRRQTEEFVEKWLARTFADGKKYPVKVFFEGEALPVELQAVRKPTD
jgi:hypothetical protein